MARGAWMIVASLCLLMVTSTNGEGVDATRQPNASGTDVVMAVVDLIRSYCIFSSDRMFLRRLAYVETRDGTLPGTYSDPNYDGGIWKVDRHMLESTQSCTGVIHNTCNLIRQTLGIDWTQVTWEDLRKPLYSGLGAVLYILKQIGGNQTTIPAELSQQATFWTQYYHREGSATNFTALATETTKYDCNQAFDMAFILDSSGSIASDDFTLSLNFTAKVVEAMDVPDTVNVAALIFEDMAITEFDFSRYKDGTKQQVLNAITSIVRSSGGTATDAALDAARSNLFQTSHGARAGVKRVAVLLTDGQSNSPLLTSVAATRLKEAGVTVFAIGVGGYNIQELYTIASSPNCSHVFTLDQFSQMDSIVYEIQKDTCKAATTLPPGGELGCSGVKECNGIGVTLTDPTTPVIRVMCGTADIYVSYENPNPGPAQYTEKYTAADGRPVYVTTSRDDTGRTLYMSVAVARQEDAVRNCTFNMTIHAPPARNEELQCCVDGECHHCTDDELRRLVDKKIVCGSYYEEFTNPCTQVAISAGRLIHPYPYDTNHFIRCDYGGNPYVTLCPHRQTFNPATMTCGYITPGTVTRQLLPDTYANPCTPEHIQAQYFYFPFPDNIQMFIHCDLWGDAWLESCPALTIWDQHDMVCVDSRNPHQSPVSTTPKPFVNPCTEENMAHGQTFFPYPCDHTRYVHCGAGGAYWVQYCPVDMYFDPHSSICLTGDPQPHDPSCN